MINPVARQENRNRNDTECKHLDFIQMVQVKVQWQSLCHTDKPSVSIWENFFIIKIAMNCSRKIP